MNARVLLLVVTAVLPVLASAQAPKPRDYDIIILGGGKTEAEAQAVLDRLKEKVLWVRLTAGKWNFPSVDKSDDYPGLNKGLYIAVLGLCAREDKSGINSNKNLVKAVKVFSPGTYSKKVRGQYGDPCPPLAAFTPPEGDEKTHLDRIAKEPRSADAFYSYGQYLKDEGRLEEARIFNNEALEIDPKHTDAQSLAETLMVLLTD